MPCPKNSCLCCLISARRSLDATRGLDDGHVLMRDKNDL